MSVKPRRTYNSPQRDEQANVTRSRILDAADLLFAERGFAAVTMEGIARAAGVSLATVYVHFPGKAAIVQSMADELTAAPDLSVEQVENEADPLVQLRIGVRILRQLNERSWAIADILRSAHGRDPALAQIWETWKERHLHAIARGVFALRAAGALRDGLSPEEAVDTFYAIAGTEVYRSLVRERGWTPDRYERWLFRMACLDLIGIPAIDVPALS